MIVMLLNLEVFMVQIKIQHMIDRVTYAYIHIYIGVDIINDKITNGRFTNGVCLKIVIDFVKWHKKLYKTCSQAKCISLQY